MAVSQRREKKFMGNLLVFRPPGFRSLKLDGLDLTCRYHAMSYKVKSHVVCDVLILYFNVLFVMHRFGELKSTAN